MNYISLRKNAYLFKNEKDPYILHFSEKPPHILDKSMRLNTSGAYILGKCDGRNTIDDITSSIVEDFGISKEKAKRETEEFLEEKNFWIEHIETPLDEDAKKKNIIGSFEGYRPNRAFLQLTYRCNMGCEYCYLPDNKSKDLDNVNTVMDNLYDWGVRHLILTGGEPMIREDIMSIIEYALDKFVTVSIQTNGSLILDYKSEILNLPKNIIFQVSLDGPRDHINSNYQGEYYEEIVEGIEILRENDYYVNLTATISEENLDYVDWIKEKSNELISPELDVNFGIVQPIGSNLEDYKNLLTDEDFTNEFKDKLGENYLDEEKSIPDKEGFRCEGGVEIVNITPEGNITPCAPLLKSENHVMGNILEDDLEKLSQGPTKKYAERTLYSEEECSNCDYFEFCERGYCMAVGEYVCDEESKKLSPISSPSK